MAEPALSLPMPSGSACDPRWRADLEALLALDERSLPSSDGLPMSDSDTQRPFLTYSLDAIKLLFADRPDVYVSGDLLVYYIGSNGFGKPVRGQVGPDVLAVFGVEDRPRDSYVMWREGPPPSFVMEIASNRTWKRDRNEKRAIYQAMGVKEYFQYDPRQNYRPPRLVGLRLYRGAYREIPFSRMPNDEHGVESATLGLYAHVDPAGRLRWFNPATGEYLRTYEEQDRERRQAESARREAEQRQHEMEAELKRLRAKHRGSPNPSRTP